MSRTRLRGAALAAAWLAASGAFAQEAAEPRIKQAQEAARANAASAEGRAWLKSHSSAIDRLMIVVLNECLPEDSADIPTVFTVYVRLARTGQVREMLTELDKALGPCMSAAAQKSAFPAAPRDDYWVAVNMAAPL